ncbi:MAG: putative Uracil-DNA glycosylase [Verrucomicrobiales bacterium]|nr:putative Uracil-DNA glycosylase [Verrucomicrobiales bacterium]
MRSVSFGPGFESWRDQARKLMAQGVPPEEVDWTDAAQGESLFQPPEEASIPTGTPAEEQSWRVPSAFVNLARMAWAHVDPRRPAVLYRLLWRLTRGGEPYLLHVPTDAGVRLAEDWRKAVARDIHKMHSFVRFRLVGTDGESGREQFVAWFEPPSRCVRLAVPFFVKRFAGMDWSILTPDECAHWDGETLHFTPGLPKDQVPGEDNLDALWRTYYRSIFNPARLKVAAMRNEMPLKYWKNLPEARLIPELIAESQPRMETMLETPGREAAPVPRNAYIHQLLKRHDEVFAETIPASSDLAALSLEELHKAAACCRACPLWEQATRTVNGEGPENARVMVVGEQPGDQEDLCGKPFTGPAGQVLRNAMVMAGLEPSDVYLTNAMKHFKWIPGAGRRRKHATPAKEEVRQCRPWVLAELARVRPAVLVLLGNTAAASLLGREVKVTQERGLVQAPELAERVILTYHPSHLLRLPEGPAQERAMAEFMADLTLASEA